jgi:hypothetical protein
MDRVSAHDQMLRLKWEKGRNMGLIQSGGNSLDAGF